jgi:hypothetical protein
MSKKFQEWCRTSKRCDLATAEGILGELHADVVAACQYDDAYVICLMADGTWWTQADGYEVRGTEEDCELLLWHRLVKFEHPWQERTFQKFRVIGFSDDTQETYDSFWNAECDVSAVAKIRKSMDELYFNQLMIVAVLDEVGKNVYQPETVSAAKDWE